MAPAVVRAVRYLRVSRAEQNVALQDDETTELIQRRGWKLVETFTDHGVSGTKDRRPALDRLLHDARRGKFQVVVVWKADRLFRSLKSMVTTLDEWSSLKVNFTSATEVFDTTTAQGRLLLHLTSAFAEFERGIIVERTKAGMAAAMRRGARPGRPRARLDEARLLELRGKGWSVRRLATEMNVGTATIQRHLVVGKRP